MWYNIGMEQRPEYKLRLKRKPYLYGEPTRGLTIRLPLTMYAAVQAQGDNKAEFIRKAIEAYLEKASIGFSSAD